MRAERADLERGNGMLEVVDRARWTGEVQDAIQGPLDVDEHRDVVAEELETGVALEVRKIGGRSGEEVVHPHHGVTGRQQPITQVRPQKPACSRYEDAHPSGRPILS